MFVIELIWLVLFFVLFLAACVAVILVTWAAFRMFRRRSDAPAAPGFEDLAVIRSLVGSLSGVDGAASVVDLGHTLRQPSSLPAPGVRDRMAIAADWAAVGRDLRAALAAESLALGGYTASARPERRSPSWRIVDGPA